MLTLLTLIWTVTPAGFAISAVLNRCQERSWSQQKAAAHLRSPHKGTALLSILVQVTRLHSWTHSPPEAHEVSMATLGKLLKGGFHTLRKLLGHYNLSTVTLISMLLCVMGKHENWCMAWPAIFRGKEMAHTEEGHKKLVEKTEDIPILRLYRGIVWKPEPEPSIQF